LEDEIDINHKISKFSDFNNSQIPPEKPLLNELFKPTSDAEVLEKLSKINGKGREEKKNGKVSLLDGLDELEVSLKIKLPIFLSKIIIF
jgi:hypothetical protein